MQQTVSAHILNSLGGLRPTCRPPRPAGSPSCAPPAASLPTTLPKFDGPRPETADIDDAKERLLEEHPVNHPPANFQGPQLLAERSTRMNTCATSMNSCAINQPPCRPHMSNGPGGPPPGGRGPPGDRGEPPGWGEDRPPPAPPTQAPESRVGGIQHGMAWTGGSNLPHLQRP